MSELPVVVVTGFGPFKGNPINNSWECVKLLISTNLQAELGVTVHVKEIPVTYEDAEAIVPELWDSLKPSLIIHVGVHRTEDIVIERCAHKKGYVREDVVDCIPSEGVCTLGSESVLHTEIDIDAVASACSKSACSTDAGRFLCEYTYYISLSRDPRRSLFVHIPPLSSNVPQEYIVEQLKLIIKNCLAQLSSKSLI